MLRFDASVPRLIRFELALRPPGKPLRQVVNHAKKKRANRGKYANSIFYAFASRI
jgi:hypothetical protein